MRGAILIGVGLLVATPAAAVDVEMTCRKTAKDGAVTVTCGATTYSDVLRLAPFGPVSLPTGLGQPKPADGAWDVSCVPGRASGSAPTVVCSDDRTYYPIPVESPYQAAKQRAEFQALIEAQAEAAYKARLNVCSSKETSQGWFETVPAYEERREREFRECMER